MLGLNLELLPIFFEGILVSLSQCLRYYLWSVVFQLFSASKKTEWFSYFINEIWVCSVANSWLVICFLSLSGWGNAQYLHWEGTLRIILSLATRSMFHRGAAWASLGSLIEIFTLGPLPKPVGQSPPVFHLQINVWNTMSWPRCTTENASSVQSWEGISSLFLNTSKNRNVTLQDLDS